MRLRKLTVLASLFIPVNFSTSLFGMNIDLLGQSTVEFWCVVVACVSITLLAYVLYLWDFNSIRRQVKSVWKGICGICSSLVGRTSEEYEATRYV